VTVGFGFQRQLVNLNLLSRGSPKQARAGLTGQSKSDRKRLDGIPGFPVKGRPATGWTRTVGASLTRTDRRHVAGLSCERRCLKNRGSPKAQWAGQSLGQLSSPPPVTWNQVACRAESKSGRCPSRLLS
jgi:hypothetical protein